jgi:ZIP family zinc transporter
VNTLIPEEILLGLFLISFLEILPIAIERLGFIEANSALLIAIVLMNLLDAFITHSYEVEGYLESCELDSSEIMNNSKLLFTGKMIAVGIFLHNLPEGIVTVAGTLESVTLGVILAIAITVHNIPEGISVAIPIYCATNDSKYAFKVSFLSGLAEPVGALAAALFLLPFLDSKLIPLSLAFVAGLMIYISIDELLPASQAYEEHHMTALGFFIGMFIIILTIGLLNSQ